MTKTDIIVAGDIHGEFGQLNKLISKRRPTVVLQCGDFGYWPRMQHTNINTMGRPVTVKMGDVKAGSTHVHFCDGNHEDHESLRLLDNLEIFPNTWYQPRGSTVELPDGRRVLFMGGADSIDKHSRIQGHSWFPEEVISYGDVLQLADPDELRVDIVISHTCPTEFLMSSRLTRLTHGPDKINDPSCKMLSRILQLYQPSLWYFGHWHVYDTGFACGCRWTALDMSYNEHWWDYLPE